VSAIPENTSESSLVFQRAARRCIAPLAAVHAALPRWWYVAPLAAGLTVLSVAHQKDAEGVAQLERLAPKIERIQALSAEARDAINRVITRQVSLIGSGEQAYDSRRKLALDRIAEALKAKDAAAADRPVNRQPDDAIAIGKAVVIPAAQQF